MYNRTMAERVLSKEPVIEEIDFDEMVRYEIESQLYTLVIEPNQYLHVCINESCVSNALVKREKCPFCGDKIQKINRISNKK